MFSHIMFNDNNKNISIIITNSKNSHISNTHHTTTTHNDTSASVARRDGTRAPAPALVRQALSIRGNHLSNTTCLTHAVFKLWRMMQQFRLAVLDK